MRLKDVVELIRVDMPDFTEGAFEVDVQADDGGTHITICVECHSDAAAILKNFCARFKDNRIIIMKVPEGSLHENEYIKDY
jgi:hypothetical protein